jgi:hypothetical protein
MITSTLKVQAVAVACCAAGVAAALLMRAVPAPHAPSPAPKRAASRAELSVLPKEPHQARVAQPAPAALQAVEGAYLGGEARDREVMVNADGWDAFYSAVKALRLPMSEIEDLVFDRLQAELGLSSEARSRLQDLYDREQAETTEAALARYGRQLLAIPKMSGEAGAAAWNDLRVLREGVRRRNDASFLAVVTAEQLEVVGRHLRNDVILIRRSVARGGAEQVLIVGAGEPSLFQ